VLTNAVKEGGGEERLLIKYICDIISASIENNPGGDDNYNLLFDYINNKRHHSNNNNNNVVNARKVGGELPFDSIATELGKTVKFLTHPQDIENLSMVSKEFTAVLRYDIDKAWKYLVKKDFGHSLPNNKKKVLPPNQTWKRCYPNNSDDHSTQLSFLCSSGVGI